MSESLPIPPPQYLCRTLWVSSNHAGPGNTDSFGFGRKSKLRGGGARGKWVGVWAGWPSNAVQLENCCFVAHPSTQKQF